jgi:uncharacterized protein YndB with AHSA1/START domain
MEGNPVIIERTFDAPVEKVWTAITDRDEMGKWYFDLKEFRAEVGFEFRFLSGRDKNNQYLHICKITEVIPEKKISYSWRYGGYEGISYVSFELFAEESTRVMLTHTGLESFPASNPDLAKENFAAGWEQIIGTSLKEYLEKV